MRYVLASCLLYVCLEGEFASATPANPVDLRYGTLEAVLLSPSFYQYRLDPAASQLSKGQCDFNQSLILRLPPRDGLETT